MNPFVILLFSPLLFSGHSALSTPIAPRLTVDSVGVERKDGRKFVLHRVDQGQTLYAVARRYKATVDAIKAANPDLTESVRYDQLLRVPVADATLSRREQRDAEKAVRKEEKEKAKVAKEAEKTIATTDEPVAKTTPKVPAKSDRTARTAPVPANGLHMVETGQTLYSLAVRYSLTMADIRRWNDLGAEGIKVGQTLIVSEKAYLEKNGEASEPAAAKARPARNTDPAPVKLEAKPIITPAPLPTPGTKPKAKSTEPKVAENKPEPEPKPVEKAEPKATEPRSDNEPVTATRKSRANADTRVQSEIGFAELIEGNDASTKYLALHRSAPIGTLVQVRNDISNQSLYVKVIGKLPDTGINNQVLIRLSGRAFEKLSPNGQRFRAEVSYAK